MAKSLNATLKALSKVLGGPPDLDELRPLEQLIMLTLCQGADTRKAKAGMNRLQDDYVDWNEVRVSGVYEIAATLKVLGAQKRVLVKAERIKDLLTTVYNRFNKLNLDFLVAPDLDPELVRKRDRFLNYLQDMLNRARREAREAQAAAAGRKATKKKAGRKVTKKAKKKTTRKPAGKTAKKKVTKKAAKNAASEATKKAARKPARAEKKKSTGTGKKKVRS